MVSKFSKHEVWEFQNNESVSNDDIDNIDLNIDYGDCDDDGQGVQIKCVWLVIIYLVV